MTETTRHERRPGPRHDSTSNAARVIRYYIGTRDALRPGDVVARGCPPGLSAGTADAVCTNVSPDLDAAIWSAELTPGEGRPRVYVVETDQAFEDASKLLSKNAPPHPYLSWRSSGSVRVMSEVTQWTYYHGTRAALKPGDMLVPGSDPNYGKTLRHIYLTQRSMRQFGRQNLRTAMAHGESTSLSRPARSRTTPMSPTSGFGVIRKSHSGRPTPCV